MTRLVNALTVVQTGTFVSGAAPITGFAFKNQQAGSGAASDAYFNNIQVTAVPEPAMFGLISLSCAALLYRRSRS